MLNNKGTTLIEVIISIALISIVLVFMIRLLIDLNNEENNNEYAINNQLNRAEILRMVENDLNGNVINNISDYSTNEALIVEFAFESSKIARINATNDSFRYTASNGVVRKWTIKDGTLNFKKANVYYNQDTKAENERIYTLQIQIEINTANEKNSSTNNNLIDDIVLSYVGNTRDFSNLDLTCLGNDC